MHRPPSLLRTRQDENTQLCCLKGRLHICLAVLEGNNHRGVGKEMLSTTPKASRVVI